MIKTSTLNSDTLNLINDENEIKRLLFNEKAETGEPSELCIQNILNYSKNLEISAIKGFGFAEYIKS